MEKGRAGDVIYLGFSKTFDTIICRPYLTTLERYELNKRKIWCKIGWTLRLKGCDPVADPAGGWNPGADTV